MQQQPERRGHGGNGRDSLGGRRFWPGWGKCGQQRILGGNQPNRWQSFRRIERFGGIERIGRDNRRSIRRWGECDRRHVVRRWLVGRRRHNPEWRRLEFGRDRWHQRNLHLRGNAIGWGLHDGCPEH